MLQSSRQGRGHVASEGSLRHTHHGLPHVGEQALEGVVSGVDVEDAALAGTLVQQGIAGAEDVD